MTRDEIFGRYVADIDQDLAACRAQIERLVGIMRARLDASESPEREFVNCTAVTVIEGLSQNAAAAFLSAAVLMLAESRAPSRLGEFTVRRTAHAGGCFILGHAKCRTDVLWISEEAEPGPMHFDLAAEDHLKRCLA